MERHRFFSCLIGVLLMICMTLPATADMKSLTDGQMGAVQGHSGTIVSTHSVAPKNLTATDTPGIVNTTVRRWNPAAARYFLPVVSLKIFIPHFPVPMCY